MQGTDGPRRLEVVKTNLCRHPPPLGLTFEGHDVPVPALRYTQLVEPLPQPTHLDLCTHWLFQFLSDAGEFSLEVGDEVQVVLETVEDGFGETRLSREKAKRAEAWNKVAEQGRELMSKGVWIIMFPEGTRTERGDQGVYKTGASRLAIATGASIIPIAVTSARCWPRNMILR